MTNEEKARQIAIEFGKDYSDFAGYTEVKSCTECYESALEMAEYKDKQLNQAIDKALEHHSKKLKEGKITQYGMDNVFAFVQNVRTLLNSEL